MQEIIFINSVILKNINEINTKNNLYLNKRSRPGLTTKQTPKSSFTVSLNGALMSSANRKSALKAKQLEESKRIKRNECKTLSGAPASEYESNLDTSVGEANH